MVKLMPHFRGVFLATLALVRCNTLLILLKVSRLKTIIPIASSLSLTVYAIRQCCATAGSEILFTFWAYKIEKIKIDTNSIYQ